MAIGVGSLVIRNLGAAATALVNIPGATPAGIVVGGAGPWEVAYADGTHDTAATTAGLIEMDVAASIPADPVLGQQVLNLYDSGAPQPGYQPQEFMAFGLAYTNAAIMGSRWLAVVPLGIGIPQGLPPARGIPYLILASHASLQKGVINGGNV